MEKVNPRSPKEKKGRETVTVYLKRAEIKSRSPQGEKKKAVE